MAKRTRRKIDQSIELIRWLFWQVLRRSPAYRGSVATLLHDWRISSMPDRHGSGLRREVLEHKRGRAFAARTALRSYRDLRTGQLQKHFLDEKGRPRVASTPLSTSDIPLDPSGSRPPGFYQREQHLMMLLQEVDANRFYPVGVRGKTLAERLNSGKRRDGLPELEEFQRKWKIRFPIPPAVEFPLEEAMVETLAWPVTIKKETKDLLVLDVDPAAGREIAVAFIRGKLSMHLPRIRRKQLKKNEDAAISGKSRPRYQLYARTITSRKHGAKAAEEVIQVRSLSRNRFRLSVNLQDGKLVANLRDVLSEISKHLPPDAKRSTFSFRDRGHYSEVFRAIDLRRHVYSQSEVARDLWPERRKDALSVENLERSFRALARAFSIPLK